MADKDTGCLLLPLCWIIAQVERAVSPPPLPPTPPPLSRESSSSGFESAEEHPDVWEYPPYKVSLRNARGVVVHTCD